MLSLVVLLILFQPREGGTSPISCYNDQGEAVDWFYLYKLPHVDREFPNDGQSYLLMGKGSEGWTDGEVLVNDSTGALGRTVGQLYEQGKNGDIAYILYNDQRPPEEGEIGFGFLSSRGGHTKGGKQQTARPHNAMWFAVVKPVGCTAKFSKITLDAAYGREMNIQLSGNSSGGHSCSQHVNSTLPQNESSCRSTSPMCMTVVSLLPWPLWCPRWLTSVTTAKGRWPIAAYRTPNLHPIAVCLSPHWVEPSSSALPRGDHSIMICTTPGWLPPSSQTS
uniref:Deoxyribonuclease-2-alpha n=1 Tax=Hucho hucho TaxID=62062 RepID=A0A4W5PHA1_9TELE